MNAGVFGVGAALPEALVANDDLAARLDTSDDWIVRRTGIRTRSPTRDAPSPRSTASSSRRSPPTR